MLNRNRNLFRITRFILLKLPGFLKFFSKFRQPRKRLLIIKTDAIGDYILFRNFIEIVKLSETYHDHQIDLLGNDLWQDITLQYDNGFINEFLFIRPDDLYAGPLKTIKLAWRLFNRNYEVVLHPTYSRTFIADGLAGFTAAKQIIGFEGDTERISAKYKVKTDKFYIQRLQIPANTGFEFDRYSFFFENVLNQPATLNGPFIKIENSRKPGIIIFPGSGVSKRSWEAEKFLALIRLIVQHTSQPVYLAGGPDELKTGDYLTKSLPPQSVNNLIAKTSLVQLIDLIGNASLVIANETSAIHIAAAIKTKVICILGGGHFGRFAPYPEQMENKPLCIYKKMECYNCNWDCMFKTDENEPYPCVSTVSLEKVWEAVLPMLVD